MRKEEQMNMFKGSDSITSPSSFTNYPTILHGYFKALSVREVTDFKPVVPRCKCKSKLSTPILHSRCKPVSVELSSIGLSTQLFPMTADFQDGLTGFHCCRTSEAAAHSMRSCT